MAVEIEKLRDEPLRKLDSKTYKLLDINNTNMFPGNLTRLPDDFFIFSGGFL